MGVDIGWAAIKLFAAVKLAKVLRVAPSLNLRPNIAMPDTETVKALVAHGTRHDRLPAQRAQAGIAWGSRRCRRETARRCCRSCARGWPTTVAGCSRMRAQLQAWIASKPRIKTLVEYRARLAEVLETRSNDAGERLKQHCRHGARRPRRAACVPCRGIRRA